MRPFSIPLSRASLFQRGKIQPLHLGEYFRLVIRISVLCGGYADIAHAHSCAQLLSRGATVVTARAEVDDKKLVLPLKPVIRAATAKDEEINRKNVERRAGAMRTVREKIEKHNLEMKLIDCEFAFVPPDPTLYSASFSGAK